MTVKVNQDGTTTITWTKDAAVIGNAESTDPDNQPWSASFQVKAKDDFIGGNMVPTNGAASGIYKRGFDKIIPTAIRQCTTSFLGYGR